MKSLDGSDSCLELVDPVGFITRLTATLNSIAAVRLISGFKTVKYQPRAEIWNQKDWGDHPVYIKDAEYGAQSEVRAVWAPKFNGVLAPINLNDIELAKYFKYVDV